MNSKRMGAFFAKVTENIGRDFPVLIWAMRTVDSEMMITDVKLTSAVDKSSYYKDWGLKGYSSMTRHMNDANDGSRAPPLMIWYIVNPSKNQSSTLLWP